MMDMQERITECYNIPENDKEIVSNPKVDVARTLIDEAIYKAGVREVVEWIEREGIWAQVPFAVVEKEETMWCLYPDEWQAKLKTWGIGA